MPTDPFTPDEWTELADLLQLAQIEVLAAADRLHTRNPKSFGVAAFTVAASHAANYRERIAAHLVNGAAPHKRKGRL